MTLTELEQEFDLSSVSRNPAQFDLAKLDHINGQYLRELNPEDFAARVVAFNEWEYDPKLPKILAVVQPRARTLKEAQEYLDYRYQGLSDDPKARRKYLKKTESSAGLREIAANLATVQNWQAPEIEAAWQLSAASFPDLKPLKLFQPLRVALTGRAVSPPMAETVAFLNKEEALSRIEAALTEINAPE